MGANAIRPPSAHRDSHQEVSAGERLSVRCPQTGPDTGFVPGGQGVAGSNPAVPTKGPGQKGFRVSVRALSDLREPSGVT
jgi:hypothetical protein